MPTPAQTQLRVSVTHSVTSHPISPPDTPTDTPEYSRRVTAEADARPSASAQPPTITQITSAFAQLSQAQESDPLQAAAASGAVPSTESVLDFRDTARRRGSKDHGLAANKESALPTTSSGEAYEIKAALSSAGASGDTASAIPSPKACVLPEDHLLAISECHKICQTAPAMQQLKAVREEPNSMQHLLMPWCKLTLQSLLAAALYETSQIFAAAVPVNRLIQSGVANCMLQVQVPQLPTYTSLLRQAGDSPDDSAASTPTSSTQVSPSNHHRATGYSYLSKGEALHQSDSLGSRSGLARTTPPSPPWNDDPDPLAGQAPLPCTKTICI